MLTRNAQRKELGNRGERLAAAYFRQRGAQVIASNVRYAVGEIDLIVRESDGLIVIVEVKTRRGAGFGVAEAVTPRKLARMRKAARQWLDGKPLATVRFDVVAIIVDPASGAAQSVEHFQGVEDGAR